MVYVFVIKEHQHYNCQYYNKHQIDIEQLILSLWASLLGAQSNTYEAREKNFRLINILKRVKQKRNSHASDLNNRRFINYILEIF